MEIYLEIKNPNLKRSLNKISESKDQAENVLLVKQLFMNERTEVEFGL